MRTRLFFVFALVVAACTSRAPAPTPPASPETPLPDPANGYGTIEGEVRLESRWERKELDVSSDPFCAAHRSSSAPIMTDAQGGLENVMVSVSDWPHVPGAAGAPDDLKFVQCGCGYNPRVAVARPGTRIIVGTNDATMHNVHGYRGNSTWFNKAQLPGAGNIVMTIGTGEALVRLACDVHPWMIAYIHVVDHPYAAVTAEHGAFRIEHVPAGDRTLTIWHEVGGTKTVSVRVVANQTTTVPPSSLSY